MVYCFMLLSFYGNARKQLPKIRVDAPARTLQKEGMATVLPLLVLILVFTITCNIALLCRRAENATESLIWSGCACSSL